MVIYGSNKSWAIERLYVKYLTMMGWEIIHFDPTKYYKTNSLFEKISYRYFPKFLYLDVNRKLLRTINWDDIDILFVFKGAELFKSTLINIKKYKVYLANYNPDHPFIRTFASSGGKNILSALSSFDLHFSYSNEVLSRIKNKYNIETIKLPFAFEPSYFNWEQVKNQTEIKKICFVGNPDKYRIRLIKKIISWNFRIDLYGNNWNNYFKNSELVTCFDEIDTHGLYTIFRKYRVQLNIFRPHNFNSHNMRSFEIAGVGGIQLAQYSQDHITYFREGTEIVLYKNYNDLKYKLLYLLNLSEENVSLIRKNTRNRSINSNYTYENRAQIVHNSLKKLIHK